MPYSVQADLTLPEQELIQLTDDAGLGQVDAAKVTAAIAAADAIIDSYAGGRYTLPLKPSVQVKTLSVELAIFELEKRRRSIREATQAARDAAMQQLRDVSSGKAQLDQPDQVQTSEADVKKPDREASPRKFEETHLKGL